MFNTQKFNIGKFNIGNSTISMSAVIKCVTDTSGTVIIGKAIGSLINANSMTQADVIRVSRFAAEASETETNTYAGYYNKIVLDAKTIEPTTSIKNESMCFYRGFGSTVISSGQMKQPNMESTMRIFVDTCTEKAELFSAMDVKKTLEVVVPLLTHMREANIELTKQFLSEIALKTEVSDGDALKIYNVSFLNLPNITLKPGQKLVINTKEMTVTIDGENAIYLLDSDSDFFSLMPGENVITYVDGSDDRTALLRTIWKDVWL